VHEAADEVGRGAGAGGEAEQRVPFIERSAVELDPVGMGEDVAKEEPVVGAGRQVSRRIA
jgi:hypothetical protein